MITIIGAGPAGLATAYYLHKQNLPCRILEKERIGYSWQSHYDSLRLHTLKGVSALPGLPMPKGYPPFPDKDQVADYLRLYAAHFGLDVQEGVEVQEARHQGVRGSCIRRKGRCAPAC